MSRDVALVYAEQMMSGVVGQLRRISSNKNGYATDCHVVGSSWATDIDGAAAEMAFAKATGVYWSGHVFNFKGADVGEHFQVRSTIYENGHLIIRETDNDDHVYVLVIAKPPVYSIRGAILARNAKVEKYWRQGDGKDAPRGSSCWWVPQSDLQNIDHLFVDEPPAGEGRRHG